jgi:membrane-associated PAP2 superfamily phosphatase
MPHISVKYFFTVHLGCTFGFSQALRGYHRPAS